MPQKNDNDDDTERRIDENKEDAYIIDLYIKINIVILTIKGMKRKMILKQMKIWKMKQSIW